MSPSFRLAEPEDRDALLDLERRYYEYDDLRFDAAGAREAFGALLADPSLGRVYVVDVEGRLAGYAVVAYGFSLEHGGRDAFLDELYLDEEYRGRGWGGHFLEFLEAQAASAGVKALHLETVLSNEDARRFYARRGYRPHDLPMMTKRLETR